MSSSYPVHVTGAGSAYYSYRPICRIIEKTVRKTYRENASTPRDFAQYMNAAHPYRSWDTIYNPATKSRVYDPREYDWDRTTALRADRDWLSRYSATAASCRASRARSESLLRCARARSQTPASSYLDNPYSSRASRALSASRYMLSNESSRNADSYASSKAAEERQVVTVQKAEAASKAATSVQKREATSNVSSTVQKREVSSNISSSVQKREVSSNVASSVQKREVSSRSIGTERELAWRYPTGRSEALSLYSNAISLAPWRYIRAEDRAIGQILSAMADASASFARSRSVAPYRFTKAESEIGDFARGRGQSLERFVRSQTPCRFTRAFSEASSLERSRSQSVDRTIISQTPIRTIRAESEVAALERERSQSLDRYVRGGSETPRVFSREQSVATTCCSRARKSRSTSRYLVSTETARDARESSISSSSAQATASASERTQSEHPYRLDEEGDQILTHPRSYWPVNRRHYGLISVTGDGVISTKLSI